VSYLEFFHLPPEVNLSFKRPADRNLDKALPEVQFGRTWRFRRPFRSNRFPRTIEKRYYNEKHQLSVDDDGAFAVVGQSQYGNRTPIAPHNRKVKTDTAAAAGTFLPPACFFVRKHATSCQDDQ
jgi:hypothetical protein